VGSLKKNMKTKQRCRHQSQPQKARDPIPAPTPGRRSFWENVKKKMQTLLDAENSLQRRC
jgi:hypothetical protein